MKAIKLLKWQNQILKNYFCKLSVPNCIILYIILRTFRNISAGWSTAVLMLNTEQQQLISLHTNFDGLVYKLNTPPVSCKHDFTKWLTPYAIFSKNAKDVNTESSYSKHFSPRFHCFTKYRVERRQPVNARANAQFKEKHAHTTQNTCFHGNRLNRTTRLTDAYQNNAADKRQKTGIKKYRQKDLFICTLYLQVLWCVRLIKLCALNLL